VEDLSISYERGNRRIKKYLRSNKDRLGGKSIIENRIRHGIKLLVFKQLVGNKTISAPLSFIYIYFRAVPYKKLKNLAEAVGKYE
jgi:hypothetical protein